MNNITVLGRFTDNPVASAMADGKAISNFSLADNHGQDKTSFFRCTAFGKTAELINNSCQKGHRLVVNGRMEEEKWQDKQTGVEKTGWKLQVSTMNFIEPANTAPQQQSAPPAQQQGYGAPPQQNGYQQQPGYGAPPQQPGYGAPPAQQGYQQPPQQQYQQQQPAPQYQQPAPQQQAPWAPQQQAPQNTYANPELPFNAPPGNRPF